MLDKASPIREFEEELNRTGVISAEWKKLLLAHAYTIASDAYNRGREKGKEEATSGTQ